MVFFSKKSKREARDRRKKLKNRRKKAPPPPSDAKSPADDGDDGNLPKTARPDDADARRDAPGDAKKRKRDDAVGDEAGAIGPDGARRIILNASLKGSEARTYRKKMRRQCRLAGEPEPVFIAADEAAPAKKNSGKGGGGTSARPSSVPRINDIVAEERRLQKFRADQPRLPEPTETEKARYVALDCEMVGTGPSGRRSVLARASLVAWDGSVLLDVFVLVPERVTDFRTWVSGVAPKHISSAAAVSPAEVRRRVGEILLGRVLVGHALHNDLKALMLDHPRSMQRDTAKYPPFMRVTGQGKLRPRKLRDLAEERVGLTIQKEGEAHSSVDDAVAAMELYKSVRGAWELDSELNKRKN